MRKRRTAGILVLALASLILTLGACSKNPGQVQGTVTRAESGDVVTEGQVVVFALEEFKDLSGLDIFLKGDLLETYTLDEAGVYTFVLPPGRYVVEAWVPGVATVSRQIEIEPDDLVVVDFEVETPAS